MSATFVEARPIDSDWLGWLSDAHEKFQAANNSVQTAILIDKCEDGGITGLRKLHSEDITAYADIVKDYLMAESQENVAVGSYKHVNAAFCVGARSRAKN